MCCSFIRHGRDKAPTSHLDESRTHSVRAPFVICIKEPQEEEEEGEPTGAKSVGGGEAKDDGDQLASGKYLVSSAVCSSSSSF